MPDPDTPPTASGLPPTPVEIAEPYEPPPPGPLTSAAAWPFSQLHPRGDVNTTSTTLGAL